MTERLSDELPKRLRFLVALNEPQHGGPYQGFAAARCVEAMTHAADELDASRKLVADLLAFHRPVTETHRGAYGEPYDVTRCRACNEIVPCPTVRLIEAAT